MKRIKVNNIWVDTKDEKYILNKAPDGFSPEKNKQVVEDSINKYEEFRKKQWKIWEEKTRERANALASFFKYLDRGEGGTDPMKKYFSRKTRAYLRGEKILETLSGGRYRAINSHGQIITYHNATQL